MQLSRIKILSIHNCFDYALRLSNLLYFPTPYNINNIILYSYKIYLIQSEIYETRTDIIPVLAKNFLNYELTLSSSRPISSWLNS